MYRDVTTMTEEEKLEEMKTLDVFDEEQYKRFSELNTMHIDPDFGNWHKSTFKIRVADLEIMETAQERFSLLWSDLCEAIWTVVSKNPFIIDIETEEVKKDRKSLTVDMVEYSFRNYKQIEAATWEWTEYSKVFRFTADLLRKIEKIDNMRCIDEVANLLQLDRVEYNPKAKKGGY